MRCMITFANGDCYMIIAVGLSVYLFVGNIKEII